MSRRQRRHNLMHQINVVPYIDVSLVLLIIFMITAPLLTRGVKVHLPQASARPLTQKELKRHRPLVLTIDHQGQFYLNVGTHPNKAIQPKMVVALAEVVLRHSPDTPVLVRGAGSASYGQVVRGMALLQAAGAKNIGLVTQTPKHPLVRKGK